MKVHALCTVNSGVDILRLIKCDVPISSVIGLSGPRDPVKISGYQDMAVVSKDLGLTFNEVSSYGLTDPSDKEKLLSLDIDVLLVLGWQRLIPHWLIEHCKLAALGGHGGPGGITSCRGRSPQNWSILLGHKQFSISLFVIDPGIDSGPVLETRDFPIGEEDDINSSYAKVTLCMADMIKQVLNSEKLLDRNLWESQKEEEALYLPQRVASDGQIDWNRSPMEICQFVRALTTPYPGAFTKMGEQDIKVLRARPFELPHFSCTAPGQVVATLTNGSLVVQASGGMVIIDEWTTDSSAKIEIGSAFDSLSFSETMDSIISRHQTKYPDLKLSPLITDQSSKKQNL